MIIVAIIYPLYVGSHISKNAVDWSNYGQYLGGTITPLAGIAAVAGVILTINHQNQQFRAVFEKSQTTEDENKILKLLEFHQNIVSNLSIQDPSNSLRKWEGKEVFTFLYERNFKGNVRGNRMRSALLSNPLTETEILSTSFQETYDQFGNDFGFYFRNLFYIFKSISACTSKIDKKHYSNLVRATFSTPEIQLLAYNCLYPKGSGFKHFVEQFGLLNAIDPNLELIDPSHQNFFSVNAFT